MENERELLPEADRFMPRHLTAEQVRGLFAQDLAQAEAGVRAAWMTLVTARLDYQAAMIRLAAVETERDRLREG